MCFQKVVYVFQNCADKDSGVFKIGCTKDVESRRKSYLSYWPMGCDVRYSRESRDARKAETLVHQALRAYKFGAFGKEFFRCPLSKIKAIIDSVVEELDKHIANLDEAKGSVTETKGPYTGTSIEISDDEESSEEEEDPTDSDYQPEEGHRFVRRLYKTRSATRARHAEALHLRPGRYIVPR